MDPPRPASSLCPQLMSDDNVLCNVMFKFNDGASLAALSEYVEAEGRPSVNSAAILGGTGKYIGARGQFTVTEKEVGEPLDPKDPGYTVYTYSFILLL